MSTDNQAGTGAALRKAWGLGPLAFADEIAHLLYCPAMGLTRSARSSWKARIHLIPAWALRLVCDRWETSLNADGDWFDNDDLTFEQVERKFNHLGPMTVTAGPPSNIWTCAHLTVTVSGGMLVSQPRCFHGCLMTPLTAPLPPAGVG